MKACPCGSPNYQICCQPYHDGVNTAPDAVNLMKSRYSAFVLNKASYLYNTSSSSLQKTLTVDELESASRSTQFVRLQVIDFNNTEVEFKAFYIENDKLHVLHERSQFIQEQLDWKYHKGELFPAPDLSLSRNDPCPCQSGNKYKKCHGR